MLGHVASSSRKVADSIAIPPLVDLLLYVIFVLPESPSFIVIYSSDDLGVQEASVHMFQCIFDMPESTTVTEISVKLMIEDASSKISLDPTLLSQLCRRIAQTASSSPKAVDPVKVLPLVALLWYVVYLLKVEATLIVASRHVDLMVEAESLIMFQHIFGILEPTTAATILYKLSNEIPRLDMVSCLQLVVLLECVFVLLVDWLVNWNRQAR
jgi:hypothetical protein